MGVFKLLTSVRRFHEANHADPLANPRGIRFLGYRSQAFRPNRYFKYFSMPRAKIDEYVGLAVTSLIKLDLSDATNDFDFVAGAA